MKHLILAIAVLLSGCLGAPAFPNMDYLCDYAQTGGYTEVYSQVELDCDAVKKDFELTEKIFIRHGTITSENFHFIVANQRFYVFDTYVFERWFTRVTGYADIVMGIQLEKTGGALLHEILHIYQLQRGILNTGLHKGWDTNGYDEMESEYFHHRYHFVSGASTNEDY